MKDLTKYIRTLIDEVDIPSEILLQEDGVYKIEVDVDLQGSWVLYRINNNRENINVRNLRVQLKKFLPQLEFVVKVNYINYPNDVSLPLLHEYKIKPREHYNNLLKLKDCTIN